MSLIHIARNNAVLGQFTEEDVRSGLANGTYLITDLAWKTGYKDWLPLGQWTEFAAPGSIPPPIFMTEEASLPAMPSWERRRELGFFSALYSSTKEILQSPDLVFNYMPKAGGFKNPFIFYLIPQAVIGILMSALIGLFVAIGAAGQGAAQHSAGEQKALDAMSGFGPVGIVAAYIVFFIIMIPAGLFLGAGIMQLMLKLWGACNASYETTFRVMAYSWGAVAFATIPIQILSLIPCVGFIFGLASLALTVWGLIIVIKGLSNTHGVSTGRVVGAVLTPVLICCCLYGIGIFMLFGAMAASQGAHP